MNIRARVKRGEGVAVGEAPSAEAPQKDNVAPLKPVEPSVGDGASRKKRRGSRLVLMASVPLVVLVAGGYVWLTGGRYVATENAYVEQTRVAVSADLAGKIADVMVRENQHVKAGDVLFRIDPDTYRIALDSANAALAQARLKVEQLQADYRTAVAKLDAAQSTAAIRHRALKRSTDLSRKGFATSADLDQAQLAVTQADNEVALAKQAVDSAVAALDGDPKRPVDKQPAVLAALADRAKAELDLKRTTVRAPVAGVVSQIDKLNKGQYVSEGTQMLSVVENGDTWIQANFKETQLADMAPGQKVDVGVDAYPDLHLKGTVGSVGAATGSEFSLIPAQNATGNWVKVVQRIPVRIRIDSDGTKVLRSGMSASVSVDTGKTRLQRMF